MGAISEIEIKGNQIVLDDALAEQVSKWGPHLKGYIEGNQLVIVPAGQILDERHPLISRYEDVAGGEPVIAGTRVTVRAIVEYERLYNDSERTLRALAPLSLEQIQDALGYYQNHTVEIDEFILQNERAYEEGAGKA